MSKIYLPTNYLNKPCYIVNNDYIRVYNTTYTNQQNVVYDIYINQDYMIKQSTANYSSSTQCDRLNTFTDDIFYRTDLADILVIFTLLTIFCIYIPIKIFLRLFRRFN